jgi:hypothetical protein
VSRTGKYKAVAIAGSVLVAAGMVVFAQMGAATPRMSVVYGMIIAGLGMGLLQPVYTIAVQNVAPRRQMGAATSSTIFFRSIGSTVGVAAFGSIMLTRYHREFAQSMPAHVPEVALRYFSNPLLLGQIRPQLEAAVGRVPGGVALLPTLFTNVKTSLTSGLHLIFVCSAIIMILSIPLHLLLRSEPLRTRVVEPELAAP